MGTQLLLGDGATPTEAFTPIVGCDSISGPEATKDTIETTSHSATGGFRTYIGGLRDSGEVTCDVFWIADPSQVALQAAYEADATVNFRVILPDATLTTYQFAGFVTNLSWDLPVDDAIKRSLTIKISGPITEIP